ncbi:hypothetical protein PLESTM_001732000 [Pleodorina starrii]|nr:hypothetical protein PLESTM_001732000 [Pleodorina starrii]
MASRDELQRAVARHNHYRAKHNAQPLIWDSELAASAQRWADRGVFEHSQPDGAYGENNALGCKDAEAATIAFYDEVAQYDFNRQGFSLATGHFTQVVWKGTQRIGIGIGQAGGRRFHVFHYAPAGNMQGCFESNVEPPRPSQQRLSAPPGSASAAHAKA